jgi:hypothetical protein
MKNGNEVREYLFIANKLKMGIENLAWEREDEYLWGAVASLDTVILDLKIHMSNSLNVKS